MLLTGLLLSILSENAERRKKKSFQPIFIHGLMPQWRYKDWNVATAHHLEHVPSLEPLALQRAIFNGN